MEKRIWTKPEMNEFAFSANEYVAACGDEKWAFNFDCTAPAGWLINLRNLFYYKDAKVDKNATKPTDWDSRTDRELLGMYHPCGKEHSTPVSDEYYWGFVDNAPDGKHSDNKYFDETVIVWLEKDAEGNIFDFHATKNLDMNSWTTAKS